MLNIQLNLAATKTKVGAIAVGRSNAKQNMVGATRGASEETKIIDEFSVELGEMNFNIQLGNREQGHFAKVYGVIEDGVRVSNLGVLADGNSTYLMSMSEMSIRDSGGKDLTFNGVGVDVVDNGLLITPSANKSIDIVMDNFSFGGQATNPANRIGAVMVAGFNLGGNPIRIVGH